MSEIIVEIPELENDFSIVDVKTSVLVENLEEFEILTLNNFFEIDQKNNTCTNCQKTRENTRKIEKTLRDFRTALILLSIIILILGCCFLLNFILYKSLFEKLR